MKDAPIAAAAAVNGGTNSVSGGGMFTFEDMMRVAAYMARVKGADASEDVQPALYGHIWHGQIEDRDQCRTGALDHRPWFDSA